MFIKHKKNSIKSVNIFAILKHRTNSESVRRSRWVFLEMKIKLHFCYHKKEMRTSQHSTVGLNSVCKNPSLFLICAFAEHASRPDHIHSVPTSLHRPAVAGEMAKTIKWPMNMKATDYLSAEVYKRSTDVIEFGTRKSGRQSNTDITVPKT